MKLSMPRKVSFRNNSSRFVHLVRGRICIPRTFFIIFDRGGTLCR